MTLRPYQLAAADAIERSFATHGRVLVVAATGTGKTVLFAEAIRRRHELSGGKRALVMAHTEELVDQAASKIKSWTGLEPDIEMADRRADAGRFFRSPVVVASVQTLNAGMQGAGRMVRFNPQDFDLVVVDEAHHAVARSYRKVLKHFEQNPDIKVLGVTATADRGDKQALGQVFDHVAYRYDMLDAIRDGYLVPVDQQMVHVHSLDFSQVRSRAGDLAVDELDRVMNEESSLHRVATASVQITAGMKTIVFAVTVSHARRLTEIFNRYEPDCARFVCGDTPKDVRRSILREYAEGRFRILVNVGVFTEGFDEPGVQAIVVARPTKSRALYTQMIGRGTRTLPGVIDGIGLATERAEAIRSSPKPSVLVLDFVGNSGKHKLVSAADILAGKHTAEAVDRAKKKLQQSGRSQDIQEALDEAEMELRRQKHEEEEERERREEEARRLRLKARAEFETQRVNPFDLFDIAPPSQMDLGVMMADAYDVKRLVGLGVKKEHAEAMTRSEAAGLIREADRRRREGLCSLKQARVVEKYGVRTGDLSRDDASKIISQLRLNGFRFDRAMRERWVDGRRQLTEQEAWF